MGKIKAIQGKGDIIKLKFFKQNKMNLDKIHFNFSSEELNNFIRTASIICVGVLTLFLLVKTINEVKTYSTIGEDSVSAPQNIINVTGKADMDVKPDITVFTFNIEESAKTVAESQSKATTKEKSALAIIKAKGIKDADIKTISYYTNTKYEDRVEPCILNKGTAIPASAPSSVSSGIVAYPYPCGSKSVESGFTTTETIEVKVRDITTHPEKTGEIVAALGALSIKASTPMSSVDNADAFKRQVRSEAIAKARAEAEVLARDLGVKIVRVVSFNENIGGYYSAMYNTMSARPAMDKAVETSPELPTGSDKITSDVSISYQIR